MLNEKLAAQARRKLAVAMKRTLLWAAVPAIAIGLDSPFCSSCMWGLGGPCLKATTAKAHMWGWIALL